ncbi:MAG: ribosomal protein S18-alanine N-acetyltransferase [Deltaproteobacteria bacterium]|nr:ribosomal protein S18-alanine N-acetyltransferase [Deltaproteobacteria bacterium]
MGEPELRPLRKDELPQALAVERAAHAHPWSPELLQRELDHDWSTVLCAVLPQDVIAGFAVFWSVHDEVHLLNVAVSPEHQRQGLGRRLLVELERRARAGSAALITLEVRASNEPALALYASQGFREVGRRKRYYSDNGEDAIVMVKELERAA